MCLAEHLSRLRRRLYGAAAPPASCRSATARRRRCGASSRATVSPATRPHWNFAAATSARRLRRSASCATGNPIEAPRRGIFPPIAATSPWLETCDAAITPLLDALELSAGRRNWGYQFRFGLFRISEHDMRTIANAMGVVLSPGFESQV